MIPMELMSMLGSTVLGGVMSIVAQRGQAEQEKQKMLMQRAGFAAKQTDKARDVKDAHTKHTRRWIALMCVFSIIVVPIMAPIFTDVNVIYQIVSEVDSGWWIFGSSYETSVWKEGNSIFITSLQSHTIFSIIGLYFGGSLTRK
jgi:hypothetical protein|tara:strand:- start:17682 stop:18113 length:432 start_codon:yes stop_codon:yes gene_type:complete